MRKNQGALPIGRHSNNPPKPVLSKVIVFAVCMAWMQFSPFCERILVPSNNKRMTCQLQPIDPIPPVETRKKIANLLETMNFTTGIEIGVQKGVYAEHNLVHWPSCKKYYLVDLWAEQDNYYDVANVDNVQQEKNFQQTKQRLKKWESKTEYYRMYSNEAAKKIVDARTQVDFVYVDARHDYCGCKEDIELFWPIIKPGGIMAGHDFEEQSGTPSKTGQDWSKCMDGSIHPEAVKGAVLEFAKKHRLHVGVTYKEREWNTWILQKPFCEET